MRIKYFLFLKIFLLSLMIHGQEKTITGTVSDQSKLPLPGASVVVKGSSSGTQTDFDGNYTINAKSGDILVFSYVGQKTVEKTVGTSNTMNAILLEDAQALDEIVVTALGIKRESKTLSYASQVVNAEQLNITQDANLKTALAGKVAGVQIQGQAGSKLGQSGKIRIRGAISLTADEDPLYVVDGVPADPNSIDMDNVASLNVLKGPNATALYGQRADAGVVVITTKKGSSGAIGIEISSSVTFDRVANLPNYQNQYGGGYDGNNSFSIFGEELDISEYPSEWSIFEGERYLAWDNNYADESWGPEFDGQDYIPWYAYWEDSPYYGQTAKYTAQPNNIRDFYDTGVTLKNTISLSGGGDNFRGRLSFTDLDQSGITPYSKLDKQFISTSFDFDVNDKLNVAVGLNYTQSNVSGDFDDGYSNQTSGSFNSWFSRGTEIDKLRELKDLTTPDGHSASWNWWGPDYYAYYGGSYKKAAFWFNPYTYLDQYENIDKTDNYVGNINFKYQINDKWELSGGASRNKEEYKNDYKVPYFLAYSSAPDLYNPWSNSFGVYRRTESENNYNAALTFTDKFGDNFDVKAFVGGNIRINNYDRFSAQMETDALTGGLILPDVYAFSNAAITPTPSTYVSEKQVNSIYSNVSLGYKSLLYLDASYRRDWSSALPSNNNGYGYPSIGTSFLFSELINNNSVLSFGKLRASWAQVGNDLDAYLLDPAYPLSEKPYNGLALEYTNSYVLDPNIKPAINTSYELGFDTKFFSNRIGLSLTYYNEKRKDEIIPVGISNGTGYASYYTNAGESERKGLEITLMATPFKTDNFQWDIMANWATNKTTINSLPGTLTSLDALGTNGSDDYGMVSVIHELGNEWGQLRGTGIARDDNGNAIIQESGLYAVETNQYLGSILPDFTGGLVNTFRYKDLSLTASIDYQKGGNFFSLTEMWGNYSGLLEETAGLNDLGNKLRDDVASGGGVHVTGVSSVDGTTVDTYVDSYSYSQQFYANSLAEPFVHDASYIKLRDVSLSYSIPKKFLNDKLSGLSLSLVGRNLWLIAVSDDNTHRWDPSELSEAYGENAQAPGTRSYGMNIKLTF
ncbi:SusC/RagA family TonB-linked outer membrane protein [Cellulophaga sp. L1A9]|uniref:SusC/RagA family TonB-linked outer membrane protein n=1 Tax=Cellulophaga sp. L1A9 TaxID=2686362 RepID=UPI00131C36BC|nr:SusC/RagA family TonB-linked outer membrane protein [Cellulophaga sp. L1A9]